MGDTGSLMLSTSPGKYVGSVQVEIKKSFEGNNIFISSGKSLTTSRSSADVAVLAGSGKAGGEVVLQSALVGSKREVNLKSGEGGRRSGKIRVSTSHSSASGSIGLSE